MGNIVAIVGRPNVGKSTLFNRLTESRQAIVDEVSGTTRDRQYGLAEWCGVEFSVIDTGGWVNKSGDVFEAEIKKHVQIAIEEADVIIFMVDVQHGLTDLDMSAAKILRNTKNRPILLVANKADTFEMEHGTFEFYNLGLGDPVPISAINGSGTGDFLDVLVSKFPKKETTAEVLEDLPKIAVVGRPNAGKSSLVNALVGEERTIVTEIAGTTRDTIHTRYNKFNFDFYLMDTAGIRKKGKVTEDLEYYSVVRSIRAIENADICVLMIDATRGIESQDMNIFSLIQKNKKGLVVAVNKWDLVEDKENNAVKAMEAAIRERFAPFVDFPIIFTSAVTKQRIFKVLETVKMVYETRKRHINTNQLNEFFLPLIENTPPPAAKGKYIKVKYVTQLKGPMTPTFIFFCSLPQYVKDPYKRFLENRLREQWDFCGVQLQLFFRQK